MSNSKLVPDVKLLKSINFCDPESFKQLIHEVDNIDKRLSLRQVIDSKCTTEIKINMLETLYDNGVTSSGYNTMLALSVLSKDDRLVSFSFSKVSNFAEEEITLLYALQEKDCNTVSRLLRGGVNITDDVIMIVNDDNVKTACKEIQSLQHFNSNLTVMSNNISEGIYNLEKDILLGHNLCLESFIT